MNNLIKLGVAGGLALGSLAANASISVGTTSGTYGNAILFADIYNGSTLVAAYAGDTGITVDSLAAGTLPSPTTFEDANLTTFLGEVATGDTVYWELGGAGSNSSSAPTGITTANNTVSISLQNGSTLKTWIRGLDSTANGLAIGSATSYLGTNISSAGGTNFAPIALTSNQANWNGATTNVDTVGLTTGATVTLYSESTPDYQVGSTTSPVATGLKVGLTTSGLQFATATAVPVPAAVWLLGSGLLGLAGVARRKITVA